MAERDNHGKPQQSGAFGQPAPRPAQPVGGAARPAGAAARPGGAAAKPAGRAARPVGAAAKPERGAARSAPDDGLDAIPMQKTNPTMIVAAVVGVAILIGLIAFVSWGGKQSSEKKVEELKARADQAGSSNPRTTLKQHREHLAMTERALKKFEQEEKEKKEAEAAKKAADQEEEERKKRVAAAAARPAPGAPRVSGAAAKKQADSLDGIGKDIAAELSGP